MRSSAGNSGYYRCSFNDEHCDSFRLLFESERGSDVTLLVGYDGSQERIPAHSWVLSYSNDYFKTLFSSSLSKSSLQTFIFPDDQPSSFINLIRWLYGCGCRPESTQSALGTLEVAIKYLCPELVHHLVGHLVRLLRPSSVLQVLAWADHYVQSCEGTLPSAPSLGRINDTLVEKPPLDCPDKVELRNKIPNKWLRRTKSETKCCSPIFKRVSSENFETPKEIDWKPSTDPTFCCRELVSQCLVYIDVNASEVLSSQMLEFLPSCTLGLVLSRDTLSLTSETLVLEALYRWANAECRRQHKPLTFSGRRCVLGHLLTLPRLLTLTSREISKMSEIYESSEISYVKSCVKQGQSAVVPPPLFANCVGTLSQYRTGCKKKGQSTFCRRLYRRDLLMDMFALIAFVID